MSGKKSASFDPENPLKPTDYVDQVIKIVQKMAPHATREQWHRFAIAARNIELSHEYHLENKDNLDQAGHPKTLTVEYAEPRLEKCLTEIETLEKKLNQKKQEADDLEFWLQHTEEFGSGDDDDSFSTW